MLDLQFVCYILSISIINDDLPTIIKLFEFENFLKSQYACGLFIDILKFPLFIYITDIIIVIEKFHDIGSR